MLQVHDLEGRLIKPEEVSGSVETIFNKLNLPIPDGVIGLSEKGLVIAKRRKDVDTQVKIGKLLRKLGHEESVCREASEIAAAEARLVKGAELKFTVDGEDVVRVYKSGPYSCMVDNPEVAVYDSPNCAVAYVESEGKVIQRAVVNTEDKEFCTLYSDTTPHLIRSMLLEAGYKFSSSLEGLLLAKVDSGYSDGNMMPYLDSGGLEDYDEDYYIISFDCSGLHLQTSGYRVGVDCDLCGFVEDILESDVTYVEESEVLVCCKCIDSTVVLQSGRRILKEECHQLHEDTYGEDVWEDADLCIEYKGDYYLQEDSHWSNYHEEDIPSHLLAENVVTSLPEGKHLYTDEFVLESEVVCIGVPRGMTVDGHEEETVKILRSLMKEVNEYQLPLLDEIIYVDCNY